MILPDFRCNAVNWPTRRSVFSVGLGALALGVVGRISAAPPSIPIRADIDLLQGIAIGDLLRNFWEGPAETGHIRPTWNGYGAGHRSLPDMRGALWERAMLFNALYEFYELRREPEISARLRADWSWVRNAFSEADLSECGHLSHANWASDDSGWDCLMLLQAYAVTGDAAPLRYARLTVHAAYNRWWDQALGGGLWYSDDRNRKSLYETALALASLQVHLLTGESHFLDYAVASEAWISSALRRPDGLYWCDASASGPVGRDRPDDIRAGGSVTYLGGNMAMSVLQNRLAKVLGRPELRQAAAQTSEAVARQLLDSNGVFLDDRDAWNDGYFSVMWAREVIPKVGLEADALRRTAAAIAGRDRSADGFYGPDWDGPSSDSRWSSGSTRPQQIMTSASAATMIIAAASLA
jgi:hypothetical protein